METKIISKRNQIVNIDAPITVSLLRWVFFIYHVMNEFFTWYDWGFSILSQWFRFNFVNFVNYCEICKIEFTWYLFTFIMWSIIPNRSRDLSVNAYHVFNSTSIVWPTLFFQPNHVVYSFSLITWITFFHISWIFCRIFY